MFSKETLKHVGYVVRLGCSMRFLPYEWNSNTLKIRRVYGKSWYYWIFSMWIGLIFCLLKISVYFNYMLKAWNGKKSESGSESQLLFELLFVIAFSYGWVFHINTYIYIEQVEDFFNNIITLNKRLGKYGWVLRDSKGIDYILYLEEYQTPNGYL